MKLRIAKEGYIYVLLSLFIGLACIFFNFYAGLLFFVLGVCIALFFRDPVRVTPSDENVILSPADGTVIDIRDEYEGGLFKRDVKKISVFMSLFNVHINYAPINGVVSFIKYKKGKFKAAFVDKASELNESNTVGIANSNNSVVLKQIAGMIARRIVCDPKVGDSVERGRRYGLIKFGSRVDVFIDPACDIRVKKGEKVKGGVTVIGSRKPLAD